MDDVTSKHRWQQLSAQQGAAQAAAQVTMVGVPALQPNTSEHASHSVSWTVELNLACHDVSTVQQSLPWFGALCSEPWFGALCSD